VSNEQNSSLSQKENLLKLLLKLSFADNQLSESELIYILHVGRSIGIDEEKIRALSLTVQEIELVIPKKEQDRMSILYYLLFLMKIDKQVDEAEEKVVYHYGFKLGFQESMVRDMVTLIRNNPDEKIPPKGMIDIIHKYLN